MQADNKSVLTTWQLSLYEEAEMWAVRIKRRRKEVTTGKKQKAAFEEIKF